MTQTILTTQTRPTTRVVLACGGSAGHVHPALAVADAWRADEPDVRFLFVGAHEGLEQALVTRTSDRFRAIRALPFFGASPWQRIRAAGTALGAIGEARRLIRAEDANMVIGFGGYVAAPVIAAAATLRIPTMIHEANADLGIGNRLVAPLADAVCTSAISTMHRRHSVLTGVPIAAEIASATATARSAPTADGPLRVFVSGGSYGSAFLDRRVPGLLARVVHAGGMLAVRHVTGRGDAAATEDAYRRFGIRARVDAFITDVAGTYAWAHVAIVCAGAVTLAEIAAVGLPCLVVPHGRVARNHQVANAKAFANATGTRCVTEDAWDEQDLATYLATELTSAPYWRRRAAALRAAARPGAAAAIVETARRVRHARRPYGTDT